MDDENSSDFDVLLKKLQGAHKNKLEELQRELREIKQREEEHNLQYERILEDLRTTNKQKEALAEDNCLLKQELERLKDNLQIKNTGHCERCEKTRIKVDQERKNSKLSVNRGKRKTRYKETQKTSPESNVDSQKRCNQDGTSTCVRHGEVSQEKDAEVLMKTGRGIEETQGVDGAMCVVPETCDLEGYSHVQVGWTQNLAELQKLPKRLDIEHTQDVAKLRSRNTQAVLAPETCYQETHAMTESDEEDSDEDVVSEERGGKFSSELRNAAVPETLPAEQEASSLEDCSLLMSPPPISSTPATQRSKFLRKTSKPGDITKVFLNKNEHFRVDIDALTPIEKSESQMPCYDDSGMQSPTFAKPAKIPTKTQHPHTVTQRLQFNFDSSPAKDDVTMATSRHSLLSKDGSFQSDTSPLLLKPLRAKLQNKQIKQEPSETCGFKLIIPKEIKAVSPGKENSPEKRDLIKLASNSRKRQSMWDEEQGEGGRCLEVKSERGVDSPPRKHLRFENSEKDGKADGRTCDDGDWIDMAKMAESSKRQILKDKTSKSRKSATKEGPQGPGIQRFFNVVEKWQHDGSKKLVQTRLSAESFKCQPNPRISKMKEYNGGSLLTADTQYDPYLHEAIAASLAEDGRPGDYLAEGATFDMTELDGRHTESKGFKKPPLPTRLVRKSLGGEFPDESVGDTDIRLRDHESESVNSARLHDSEYDQMSVAVALNGSIDPALELSKLDEDDSEILVSREKVSPQNLAADKIGSSTGDWETGIFPDSPAEEFTESFKFGKVDRVRPQSWKPDARENASDVRDKKLGLRFQEEDDVPNHGDDSCMDMFDGNGEVDEKRLVDDSNVTDPNDSAEKNDCPEDVDQHSYQDNHDQSTLDSFNKVPKLDKSPNFKHVKVVRKKDERRKLNAFDCKQCEEYFEGLGLSDSQKAERMKECSRHRGKYIPPSTPEHYWEMDMPSTQTCHDRGYMQEVSQHQPQRRRRRQPYNKRF